MKHFFILSVTLLVFVGIGSCQSNNHTFAVKKTDAEWKKQLSKEAYVVTRKEGTETAFTGAYWDNHKKGIYTCVCCDLQVFSSATKFDSGTGWPSFWKPLNKTAVLEEHDNAFGMQRTKITCSRCGAHLGHVFEDGPKPTGLRYCINSVSLRFVKS